MVHVVGRSLRAELVFRYALLCREPAHLAVKADTGSLLIVQTAHLGGRFGEQCEAFLAGVKACVYAATIDLRTSNDRCALSASRFRGRRSYIVFIRHRGFHVDLFLNRVGCTSALRQRCGRMVEYSQWHL